VQSVMATDRDISRAAKGPPLQPGCHVGDLQEAPKATEVGPVVVAVPSAGTGTTGATPRDGETTMNAKTESARNEIDFSQTEVATPPRQARVTVLSFAAIGLWILAVMLGIGAPLLGVDVDARLVVGVLVASGAVSLLSLPVTAMTPRGTSKPADHAERPR